MQNGLLSQSLHIQKVSFKSERMLQRLLELARNALECRSKIQDLHSEDSWFKAGTSGKICFYFYFFNLTSKHAALN